MHQAERMRALKPMAELDRQVETGPKTRAPAVSNPFPQVAAVHVLDDEQQEIVQRLGIVAVGDVGMQPELGPGLSFAHDAVPVGGIGQDLRGRNLDGDIRVPLRLPRQPDLTHAAPTEAPRELKVAGHHGTGFDASTGWLRAGRRCLPAVPDHRVPGA
jgi:hypothetical protein